MEPYAPIDFFTCLAESKEFAEFTAISTELVDLRVTLHDSSFTRTKSLHDLAKSSPLCSLIRVNQEGLASCNTCDREYCARAVKSGHAIRYDCHAGLIDMAIPVFVEGRHIASLMCGQFLASPASEKGLCEFCQRNHRFGLTPAVAREAYYQAPYLPSEKIDLVLRLFSFFVNHFCETLRRIRELSLAKERNEILAARQYIQAHFYENITLADLADHVHLSPAYFSHLFHQIVGVSLTNYIQKVRVEGVKKRLKTTTDSITRIAFDCGFNNLAHFNRVFRKFEGCAPGYYRKCKL